MDDEDYDLNEDLDEEDLEEADSDGLNNDSEFDDARRDLSELEELGTMDGQQDAISGSFYTSHGMSVDDLDDLSDEEREAYETGYHTGFGAGGGWQ